MYNDIQLLYDKVEYSYKTLGELQKQIYITQLKLQPTFSKSLWFPPDLYFPKVFNISVDNRMFITLKKNYFVQNCNCLIC